MPRANPNPSQTSATQEIYPDGDYELLIGRPKAFARYEDDGVTIKNFGIGIPMRIAEPVEHIGKQFYHNLYYHTDGAKGMNKLFLMAALGYTRDEEKRFDAEHPDEEWAFDYGKDSDGFLGNGWLMLENERVTAEMSQDIQKKGTRAGEPQQKVKWRPFGK